MEDIMYKAILASIAVASIVGAKIVISMKSATPTEIKVMQEVEKVAEEVIKEETGITVDLEKKSWRISRLDAQFDVIVNIIILSS